MEQVLSLKPHGTPGKLITFCGLDGCGKSTMISMLCRELENKGHEVMITKQPTDLMRSTNIFRTFMDAEDHSQYSYRTLSLMAVADRIQHVNHVILPALQDGKTVICDRYFYSCLANLRARGYEGDNWIYEIAKAEIPSPDLAIFLDVPVDAAVTRVRERPEEKDRYIDMELQCKLHQQYQKICREIHGISISSFSDILLTFCEIWEHVKKMEDK